MDRNMLQGNDKQFIILQEVPQVLFIEMEKLLLEPYPGLPDKWFPMLPVDAYWSLDAEDTTHICRRGFPLLPNSSSTVDSATGQTMKRSIPDQGDVATVPSKYVAMRGYIALS